jgi:hypothetical protein
MDNSHGLLSAHLHSFAKRQLVYTISLWGVGLPNIMNPHHGIAVLNVTVVNANLYFFSWLALANCLFLLTSLVQDVRGIAVRDVAQPKLARWIALTASSLVVMGSAVRIFTEDSYDCGNPDSVLHSSSFCRRTRVAIAFGTVSIVASMLCAVAVHRALLSTTMELVSSSLVFVFWCFGVASVTFGFAAPGSRIGNLFFSTWISFLLSMISFGSSFQAWHDSRISIMSNNTNHEDGAKDADEEHTDEDEEDQTDVVDFPTNYRSEVPVLPEEAATEEVVGRLSDV